MSLFDTAKNASASAMNRLSGNNNSGGSNGNTYNNLFSNYDNRIEEQDRSVSLKDKFKNMVTSITGDAIKSLNQLKSTMSSFNLKDLLGGISDSLNSLINNKIDVLSSLGSSASLDIISANNANILFQEAIVNKFKDEVSKVLFFPEETILPIIKSLYVTGANLAYNDDYTRKLALTHDLVKILKFCDAEYKIKYNSSYKKLEQDLFTCAKSSAYRNLFYMYEELMKEINVTESVANDLKIKLDTADKKKSDSYKTLHANYLETSKTLMKYKLIMLQSFKELIVNSTTYINADEIKRFFDTFSTVLKPRYFGSSDNVYSRRFMFTSQDIDIMMPFYSKESGDNENEESGNTLGDISGSISSSVTNYVGNYVNDVVDQGKSIITSPISTVVNTGKNVLSEARSSLVNKMSSGLGFLPPEVIGINNVEEKLANAGPIKKPEKDVYYGQTNIGTINKAIDKAASPIFDINEKYINPRNKNIKSIYVLMSSEGIYGNDRMVHRGFYERASYESIDSIAPVVDNALGAVNGMISGIVKNATSGVSEMLDSVDGAIYRYMVAVSDNINDPQTMGIKKDNVKNVQFSEYIADSDDATISKALEEEIKKTNKTLTQKLANRADEIMRKAMKSPDKLQKIAMVTKFSSDFPANELKDIIVKYFGRFKELCQERGISSTELDKVYPQFIAICTCKDTLNSKEEMNDYLSEYSTPQGIANGMNILMAVFELRDVKSFVNFAGITRVNSILITECFYVCMALLRLEYMVLNMNRGVFIYDTEFLYSYYKDLFYIGVRYFKKLVEEGADPKIIYQMKDALTVNYAGYAPDGVVAFNTIVEEMKFCAISGMNKIPSVHTSFGDYYGGDGNYIKGIRYYHQDTDDLVYTNITEGRWIYGVNMGSVAVFVNENNEVWATSEDNPLYFVNSGISAKDWDLVYDDIHHLRMAISKQSGGVRLITPTTRKFKTTPNLSSGGPILYKEGKIANYLYSVGTPSEVCCTMLTEPYKFGFSGSMTSWAELIGDRSDVYTYFGCTDGEVHTITWSKDAKDGYSGPEYLDIKIQGKEMTNPPAIDRTQNGTYQYIIDERSFVWSNPDKTRAFFCKHVIIEKLTITVEEDDEGSIVSVTEDYKWDLKLRVCELLGETSSELTKLEFIDLIEKPFVKYWYADTIGTYFGYKTAVETGVKLASVEGTIDRILDNQLFPEYENFEIKCWSDNGKYVLGSIIKNEKCVELFNLSNKTVEPVIKGKNLDATIDNDGKMFVSDTENENFGIKLIDNDKFVETNITSGKWMVQSTPEYFVAISTNGTNEGVKISNKDLIYFTDIPKTPVRQNDFVSANYDPNTQYVLLGQDTKNMVFDPDSIKYDIDEIIYSFGFKEINKKISRFGIYLFDAIYDSIFSDFSDKVYTQVEKNKIGTPSTDTLYFSNNNSPIFDLLQFEVGVDYYIFGKTSLDDVLSKMREFSNEIESIVVNNHLNFYPNGIYKSILDININDKELIDKLILGLITNSKINRSDLFIVGLDNGNGQNGYSSIKTMTGAELINRQLLNYQMTTRDFIIFTHGIIPGAEPPKGTNEHEKWQTMMDKYIETKAKYDINSDEFLENDELLDV